MHQMLIKEDLLPDLNEAKEVLAQLDALFDLLSEKRVTKIKGQFNAEFIIIGVFFHKFLLDTSKNNFLFCNENYNNKR